MPFKKAIEAVQAINNNVNEFVLDIVARPDVTELILDANRSQLNSGVDANRNPIEPPYTETTIRFKISKGQEFRWVTLRDTGAFQESFKLIFHRDSFEIVATDSKRRSLKQKYGAAILGLHQTRIEAIKLPIEVIMTQELKRGLTE